MARTDDTNVVTSLSARRLLAVRADGQGMYFQFQGFARRRYETSAYVWSVVGGDAVLCLPEWHPNRPVHLPARLLPPQARRAGEWLRLRCDLSASSAARLQPADLRAVPDHGWPVHLQAPAL